MHYSAVLLGLVVLRTMERNGFCPICTKGCCMVLTRSKSFWGQICKTDSHTHQSNKRAALVPLRNVDTNINITGFSQVKSPTNQYISFVLQQEVVCKPNPQHSRTPPLSPRETPLFGRVRTASVYNRIPKRPFSGCFTFARAAS